MNLYKFAKNEIQFVIFTYRMDKDGSLTISFNEWRDFLLYAPSSDLLGLIEYWHHTNVSN